MKTWLISTTLHTVFLSNGFPTLMLCKIKTSLYFLPHLSINCWKIRYWRLHSKAEHQQQAWKIPLLWELFQEYSPVSYPAPSQNYITYTDHIHWTNPQCLNGEGPMCSPIPQHHCQWVCSRQLQNNPQQLTNPNESLGFEKEKNYYSSVNWDLKCWTGLCKGNIKTHKLTCHRKGEEWE